MRRAADRGSDTCTTAIAAEGNRNSRTEGRLKEISSDIKEDFQLQTKKKIESDLPTPKP